MPKVLQLHLSWAETDEQALANAMTEWPNGGMKFAKADIRSPHDFAAMAALVRPEDFEGRMVISADPDVHRADIQRLRRPRLRPGLPAQRRAQPGASGSRSSAATCCPSCTGDRARSPACGSSSWPASDRRRSPGMLLADLGADVVRIDRPGGPALAVVPPEQDLLGRGKRSVALDLKDPDDVRRVLDLVGASDLARRGHATRRRRAPRGRPRRLPGPQPAPRLRPDDRLGPGRPGGRHRRPRHHLRRRHRCPRRERPAVRPADAAAQPARRLRRRHLPGGRPAGRAARVADVRCRPGRRRRDGRQHRAPHDDVPRPAGGRRLAGPARQQPARRRRAVLRHLPHRRRRLDGGRRAGAGVLRRAARAAWASTPTTPTAPTRRPGRPCGSASPTPSRPAPATSGPRCSPAATPASRRCSASPRRPGTRTSSPAGPSSSTAASCSRRPHRASPVRRAALDRPPPDARAASTPTRSLAEWLGSR